MWTTDDSDQLRWSIPCATGVGEERTVTVLVLGDRVAIVLPPGDTLILYPGEATDFATMLDTAAAHTDTTS